MRMNGWFGILGFLLGSGIAQADVSAFQEQAINPIPQKWTYIRIVDYDSQWGDGSGNEVGPTLEEAIQDHLPQATPDNVNYVMLAAGWQEKQVAYGYLTPAQGSGATGARQVLYHPATPMNSVETYAMFFDWVAKNFPAEHYVLSYWGHGGGAGYSVGTLGYTSLPGGPGLTVNQWGQVVELLHAKTSKLVDVVFLCTCLNGTTEDAYAIRNSARYFVAGETTVGCVLEPFNILQESRNLTAEQLSVQTVDSFDQTMTGFTDDIVYSAIRLSEMQNLEKDVSRLGSALATYAQADPSHPAELVDLTDSVDTMGIKEFGPSMFDTYLDLGGLAAQVALRIPGLHDVASSVVDDVDRRVIARVGGLRVTGGTKSHSHGISIVHPSSKYSEIDLDYYGTHEFAIDSQWPAYLALVSSRKSQAQELPLNFFDAFFRR